MYCGFANCRCQVSSWPPETDPDDEHKFPRKHYHIFGKSKSELSINKQNKYFVPLGLDKTF